MATTAVAADDVFLEAELSPSSGYVQAQVLYRLRFFQAIDVRDVSITAAAVPLAQLRELGGEEVQEARRNGRQYRVRERRYALIPYASGPLEIVGGRARGRRVDGSLIERTAPAVRLEVRPVPAAADPAWLPARSVTLSETWTPPLAEALPGAMLRRTLRVEASGVEAAQIPDLAPLIGATLPAALPARLENRSVDTALVGSREQSFHIRVAANGTLSLAELRLPWWNVTTDSAAVASLPARQLGVAAIAEASAAAAPEDQDQVAMTWAWIAAALLPILALAYWLRRPLSRARWQLYRASRGAQGGTPGGTPAAAMRDVLLAWAAITWPAAPPRSLGALADRCDDADVQDALGRIDASLYGRGISCDRTTLRRAARIKADSVSELCNDRRNAGAKRQAGRDIY